MSEPISYTVRGELQYPKPAAARKARSLLSKSPMAAFCPGPMGAIQWDGSRGFTVDHREPVQLIEIRPLEAWGAAIQALSILATEANAGEVVIELLEDRRIIQPGGGALLILPEVPSCAVARLGSLALRAPYLIRALAFSPDGRQIAVAHQGEDRFSGKPRGGPPHVVPGVGWWGDGDIRIWDVEAGAFTRSLFPCSNGARRLQFSPDGRLLLALTERHSSWPAKPGRSWAAGVHLFDLETGYARRLMKSRALGAAFSPDGLLVVTWTAREIVIWEAATGKKGLKVERRDADLVGAALCADGEHVVAFSADGWMRKVRIADGAEAAAGSVEEEVAWVVAVDRGDEAWVMAGQESLNLPISLAGPALSGEPLEGGSVVADHGRALLLPWSGRGEPARSLRPAGEPWPFELWSATSAFALTPDGALAISDDGDHLLYALDALTGAERPGWSPPDSGHRSAVAGATIGPDGRVATGGWDRTVRLWTPDGALERVLEPGSICNARRFSSEGRWLAVCGTSDLYLYDLRDYSCAHHPLPLGDRYAAFTPDETRLITADYRTVAILDLETGREQRIALPELRNLSVTDLLVRSDSRALVSAEEHLFELDLDAAAILRRAPLRNGGRLRALPDGRVQNIYWNELSWLDPDRLTITETAPLDAKPFFLQEVSPDGRWHFEQFNRILRVREPATGRVIWSAIGHPRNITFWPCAFSPDSRRLVTIGNEGTAVIWRLDD